MVTTMLAWPLRLLRPIEPMVKRVLFLTLAKVKIPSLNASIQIDGLITVLGTANVSIGSRSRISRHVELGTEERGEIHIGEQVRINRGSTIFAYEEIRIGDHTLIGEFVTIRDANHGIAAGDHIRSQEHEAQAIHIGTDVWIGRGTVILPGVRIGDHCVIGANSVVTKDIEPGMVAVGSPARAIRER
jgi:acetyltransferase-like isoleucine patch superfamily enzyme